jgi:acyl-coenzyme A synthetase/AMP-(fatty) acid ligase/acyl carrier protein
LQDRTLEYCDRPNILQGLKEVIATGEQLKIDRSIIRLFNSLQGCGLHNHYGPSETHVVTGCILPENADQWDPLPSIGRPIFNSSIYLLDENLNPTAIGAPGELYIGGIGLGRGYWRRPDLTSERFLPDPFSPASGSCMYKSGDLARFRTNGLIEFLGRIDHQVKIRGFRIELGEIESVLARHESVRQAVVLVREVQPGNKQLVAYIIPRQETAFSSEVLRGYLRNQLPDYMTPSIFVSIDQLPLTPNGKLDRRRLPEPELNDSFVPAHTDAERVVTNIWASVLKVDQVGIRDNFFELGGHSLRATQSVSQMRQVFGMDFPLTLLFQNPTIEGLIAAMSQLKGSRDIIENIAAQWIEIESLSEEEVKARLADI